MTTQRDPGVKFINLTQRFRIRKDQKGITMFSGGAWSDKLLSETKSISGNNCLHIIRTPTRFVDIYLMKTKGGEVSRPGKYV